MNLANLLLPEKYRDSWFIAGGYAVCPALATDIDVWVQVMSPDEENVDVARTEILNYLLDSQELLDVASESAEHVDTESDEYGNIEHRFTFKVAIVQNGNATYHILVTNGTIQQVLDSFDISTARVALLPTGRVVKGRGWTPMTELPEKLRDTPTTDARMNKYLERFGHRPKGRVIEFNAEPGNFTFTGSFMGSRE